jgi:hypothetical protein
MTGSTDNESKKIMQCKTPRVIITCNIHYNIVHNKDFSICLLVPTVGTVI